MVVRPALGPFCGSFVVPAVKRGAAAVVAEHCGVGMPAPAATESDTLCVYKRPVRDTLCMYYKRSGIHPAGTHCPANGVAAGRGTLIAQGRCRVMLRTPTLSNIPAICMAYVSI